MQLRYVLFLMFVCMVSQQMKQFNINWDKDQWIEMQESS